MKSVVLSIIIHCLQELFRCYRFPLYILLWNWVYSNCFKALCKLFNLFLIRIFIGDIAVLLQHINLLLQCHHKLAVLISESLENIWMVSIIENVKWGHILVCHHLVPLFKEHLAMLNPFGADYLREVLRWKIDVLPTT